MVLYPKARGSRYWHDGVLVTGPTRENVARWLVLLGSGWVTPDQLIRIKVSPTRMFEAGLADAQGVVMERVTKYKLNATALKLLEAP